MLTLQADLVAGDGVNHFLRDRGHVARGAREAAQLVLFPLNRRAWSQWSIGAREGRLPGAIMRVRRAKKASLDG